MLKSAEQLRAWMRLNPVPRPGWSSGRAEHSHAHVCTQARHGAPRARRKTRRKHGKGCSACGASTQLTAGILMSK